MLKSSDLGPSSGTGPIAENVAGKRCNGLCASIGYEVRSWRERRGLKLADLAREANLSMAALSRIENGTISPSLTTLRMLSRALGVPIASLLSRFEQKQGAVFARAPPKNEEACASRHAVSSEALGRLSIPESGVKVEPRFVQLVGLTSPLSLSQHSGMKFHYMLKGEVRYRHGSNLYTLRPGDSLLLDASVPHGPEELIKVPVWYLSIAFDRLNNIKRRHNPDQ